MTPKTKDQFQQIRQRSRTAILDAALTLFAEKGYNATSISMISKEAGISKGLMYNYFSGKEELLKAIILDAMEMGESWLVEEMETEASPEEHFIHLVNLMVDRVKDNPRYWKLLTRLAFQREVIEPLRPLFEEKKQKTIELAIELFSSMGYQDPLQEAFFFGATMDGLFFQYLAMGDEYPLDTLKDHIINRFILKK